MLKIHLLDTDPRKNTDPNYHTNMGSFSIVANGFNNGLKTIGAYAEPEEADYVGICDGLNLGFKYQNKKTFVINVWDCINVLPQELVMTRKYNPNLILFGLSNQISNLWQKYNFPCETTMPGCDASFWYQTSPKNKEFTFFFNSFGNVRSGLDLAVKAFSKAFSKKDNVRLLINNTSESKILHDTLTKFSLISNISFRLGKRISFTEMRDLYSSSHISLNVMRHSSWGLNIHEAMACGCFPIVGDFCPSNEIVDYEHALFLKPKNEILIKDKLIELLDFGLQNAYGGFTYKEQPLFYDYSIEEYASLMRQCYEKWNSIKEIDTRQYILNNWSWEKAAKNLYTKLNEK